LSYWLLGKMKHPFEIQSLSTLLSLSKTSILILVLERRFELS
jgi:hypothetical protein